MTNREAAKRVRALLDECEEQIERHRSDQWNTRGVLQYLRGRIDEIFPKGEVPDHHSECQLPRARKGTKK